MTKNTLRRKCQKADLIYVRSKVLRRLVRGAMKSVNVRRLLADCAYD